MNESCNPTLYFPFPYPGIRSQFEVVDEWMIDWSWANQSGVVTEAPISKHLAETAGPTLNKEIAYPLTNIVGASSSHGLMDGFHSKA